MTSIDISARPRVLIADDSRIVRATLIKRIEGMFEFREALDGEQAWETLLIDPNIRVVITDLTMPKLDGYGLLERIRTSKIARIRDLPVVVVSGSDEAEERERAKTAGATDLITKGIGTAQLLSRLDILSKLVNTQREFERSLEALVREHAQGAPTVVLPTPEELNGQAELMMDNAVKHRRNFVLLKVCVGLKHAGLEGNPALPPAGVVNAVGQLLQRTIRQTDCVAQTGDAEFTLATGSIHSDSARNFARRVCHAVANAHLLKDERIAFVASCGMVAWPDTTISAQAPQLAELHETARRRADLGMDLGLSGVVGAEEERAFKAGRGTSDALPLATPADARSYVGAALSPDLATLLQWMKEGKQEQVLAHLDQFSAELKPLIDLMLQQGRGSI